MIGFRLHLQFQSFHKQCGDWLTLERKRGMFRASQVAEVFGWVNDIVPETLQRIRSEIVRQDNTLRITGPYASHEKGEKSSNSVKESIDLSRSSF